MYNCCLQVASSAIKVDRSIESGVQQIVINGTVHHRMGGLQPNAGCIDPQVESHRLSFVRHNQAALRADLYRGLRDALTAGEGDARAIGQRIVLPSSFTCGPRHMQQLLQDAMCIVRHKGKPSLFITMTCNPKWSEIKGELLEGQSAADRPDLTTRVFMLKFKELMRDLTDSHALGRVTGHVHCIEFQKRGLPHAHILLCMAPEDQLRGPEDYDSVICAEIPDPAADPALYETVTHCNLHGPCRADKCLKDGKCDKRFPKAWAESTVEGCLFTNQHVVPYNPALSKKFNCHINVEACASIKAIKYTYAYVYKGHDRAQVGRQELGDVDEIRDFTDGRYISCRQAHHLLTACKL
ncbi:helitron_like_N domain-containing protein [Haematococcus lacustris]|uniref:Helitron_like_N domain-containing protein n=1 Tax=Haematococcus lacustris TaxID=44745 RepID=A0A6A0AB14_HAELA|nr:helitron_like_N domain-containing protein [Haematococcus lacustris]